MSTKEHSDGDDHGNRLEEPIQVSIDTGTVKFLSRNRYWTRDYTTGIKLFVRHMRAQNDTVIRYIKFYSDFTDMFWKPALNDLQKLEPTNSMNKQLLEFMKESFNRISPEKIESDCKKPLQNLKNHNDSFLREAENDLSSRYSVYVKDLVRVKEALIECEKKIQICKLRQVDTPSDEHSRTSNSDKDETSSTRIKFICEFPYALDERLKFDNSVQFMSFLQNLKKNVRLQKSMFPVPGLPNGSFQGQSLVKELKKLEPKLDLSLFNIDRIGNEFTQLGIIKEYSLSFYSNKNPLFDQEKYYYWNGEIFDNQQERNGDAVTKAKKSYGDLSESENVCDEKPNVSSIKTSISDWIRKVSLNDNDERNASGNKDINENDWEALKQQLQSLQDKFFSRCCQLEYSKVQLEKTIYEYCKNYSRVENEIERSLKSSDKIFQQICESFTKSPIPPPQEEVPPRKGEDIEIRGFFLRDNGIPFRKWNNIEENDPVKACKEISIKCEKFFCGSEINNDLTFLDTLETIKIILQQIEKEPNAKKIVRSWHDDIDFVRVSNLKRDLMGKFKESKAIENTNSTITAQFLENLHTYVTNDFVGLIKLWLLELPDSIVPSNSYDTLVKTKEPLISLCGRFPTNTVRFLQEFTRHFQVLNCESSLPPRTVCDLFIDNSDIDIPLAHHFSRRTGLQDPTDINILSPALYTLFTSQDTIEILQQLIASSTNTSTSTVLQEPPKIVIKNTASTASSTPNPPLRDQSGPFIPRPFKTSSTPTTPERTKRKSGLFLPVNVNDRPPT
ncbi:hypothetical protein SUVZ_15G3370 [Saccharomyces uvarum]|uniref:Rho-GAP domain-containing protein n=1 Tax=Saccharomyces uvarum TaxID=230603 RepID=A0ABN8WQP6_SACUV|nr:hypothetical protein SUVZ_15G3370 [Saccharomyces uvarum]